MKDDVSSVNPNLKGDRNTKAMEWYIAVRCNSSMNVLTKAMDILSSAIDYDDANVDPDYAPAQASCTAVDINDDDVPQIPQSVIPISIIHVTPKKTEIVGAKHAFKHTAELSREQTAFEAGIG
uniref:Uncharacterized protein n=1 Tax=Amphimedon queenslandica TaxID=400682 RepID=A0A1X7UBD1_AMPQE